MISEEKPTISNKQQGKIRQMSYACRICFSLVFFWNVLCALQFVITPDAYVAGFELNGEAGSVAVRGLGIAFLMWNATYPAFIASPTRFKFLGGIILVQQLIGLVGESYIYFSLSDSHALLLESIARFIGFDGAGFIIMGVTFGLLLNALRHATD